jgi:outer membrane protein assembly factor BamB
MKLVTSFSRVLVCSLVLTATAFAQVPCGPDDFPQWRGPNRDGISRDRGLLKKWPKRGPEVVWQVDDVGVGYSSVAIKDGLIVTMGDLNGVEHIIALRVEDGSRVWAVQPKPVATALAARVEREFIILDRNKDGVVDEVEALFRLGWDFHKYDRGAEATGVAARAKMVISSLDSDSDGRLTYAEAGQQFRDRFPKMDSSDSDNPAEIAERRSAALIKVADADQDGKVSRQESRKSYLARVFSRADQRDPATRKSDQVLTREEIVAYFKKYEGGADGVLTAEEVTNYYESQVKEGDGQLSRAELAGSLGGFRNGQGDGPRGTPTIDGDRVYVEGGNGDLACLALHTGETLWHTSLTADLGGSRPGWGYSESPLITSDLVIVTPGGRDGAIAALNKEDGKVVWRSKDYTDRAHYSSPVVATLGGVAQIVQLSQKNVFGVALDGGELLWTYSGACNGTANCCTPIVADDHVFAASAYGTGGGLVKISNDGGGQKATEAYFEKKMGVHHGGIVKIGDYMYTNGAGSLTCINYLTGEIAWQNRSVGKGSLVAADGMLYVLSERQKIALVEATPEEYRELGRIEIESRGRPSWAHPVVAGGVLYIRDQHTLTAYKVR